MTDRDRAAVGVQALSRSRLAMRWAELERCSGTQFDPVVVSAFQAVLTEPARARTHERPSETSAAGADRPSAS